MCLNSEYFDKLCKFDIWRCINTFCQNLSEAHRCSFIFKGIYHEHQTDMGVVTPLEVAFAQKIWPVSNAPMAYFMHTQITLRFLDEIGFNKDKLFDTNLINERVSQYIKQGKATIMT